MKTLYIIGNGFDIAHGLDTKYWKFREFLEEHHTEFLYQFENLYNIQPIDESDPRISQAAVERWKKSVDNSLWSVFEDKMGNPDIQSMMDFSASILDDMNLDGGLIGIRDTMNEYWRDQYGYVQKLQQYLKEWIETVDTSVANIKKDSLVESDDIFLNFNYTDLLERVYKIDDVFHIHGGVGSVSGDSPIIGHCNKKDIDQHNQWAKDADEEYAEGEASIHEAVVDYLESIYKDTDRIIRFNDFFWDRLNEVNRVIIIGWSAGEVDRPYLKKVKECVAPDTTWNYYWYSPKDKDSIEEAFTEVGIADMARVDKGQSNDFWDK